MRVCLAFLVVEQLRAGVPVAQACREGIRRLKECFRQSHPGTFFSSTFSLGELCFAFSFVCWSGLSGIVVGVAGLV